MDSLKEVHIDQCKYSFVLFELQELVLDWQRQQLHFGYLLVNLLLDQV